MLTQEKQRIELIPEWMRCCLSYDHQCQPGNEIKGDEYDFVEGEEVVEGFVGGFFGQPEHFPVNPVDQAPAPNCQSAGGTSKRFLLPAPDDLHGIRRQTKHTPRHTLHVDGSR